MRDLRVAQNALHLVGEVLKRILFLVIRYRGRPFRRLSTLLCASVASERLLKSVYGYRGVGEILTVLREAMHHGTGQCRHISFSPWERCHLYLLYSVIGRKGGPALFRRGLSLGRREERPRLLDRCKGGIAASTRSVHATPSQKFTVRRRLVI
jgi:hypothetical protein